jgi:hypothetical protein
MTGRDTKSAPCRRTGWVVEWRQCRAAAADRAALFVLRGSAHSKWTEDGGADVIGAAENDDDVTWWENDGGVPPAWTEQAVADGPFDGARSVYAADVDSDGDLDVLGAALYDNGVDFAWWENGPCESYMPLALKKYR